MAISHTFNPTASVHRPIVVTFSEQQTNANNPIVQFRIKILDFFTSKEYGTVYVKAKNSTGLSFYFGDLDISGLVKKQLPPYNSVGNIFGYGGNLCLSLIVICEPMMLNNSGLLEDFGTSYATELITAVSCSTLPEENGSLEDFLTNPPILRNCLTNNDFCFEITTWQDTVLTCISDDGANGLTPINACMITVYDANDNILQMFYFDIILFTFQLFQVTDIGQFININNWQNGNYLISGSLLGMTYFKADFGRVSFNPDGSFAYYSSRTREYKYKFIDCKEDDTIVLQWFNIRGGQDTYVFNKQKLQTLNTKVQIAEAPLTWNFGDEIYSGHDPRFRGKFKVENNSTTAYELVSRNLSKQEVNWIRELIESNDVYIQLKKGTSIEYVPCIITDANFTMYDNEQLHEILRIKIILSNERIIQ